MPAITKQERDALRHYLDAQTQADINSRVIISQGGPVRYKETNRKDRHDGTHFVLRKLLEKNINNPLAEVNYPHSASAAMFEAYPGLNIECVLVRGFPEMFQWNAEGYLGVRPEVVHAELIRGALGFDLNGLENQCELNLAAFRHPILQDLYSKDGNILWVVLQSVKPVTEDFTNQDKIDCYIELAHAFYRDGTPHLVKQALSITGQRAETNQTMQCIVTPGLDTAYKGAWDMACCAYAMACGRVDLKNQVNDAFFPKPNQSIVSLMLKLQNFNVRFTTWLSGYATKNEWEDICRQIDNTVQRENVAFIPGKRT